MMVGFCTFLSVYMHNRHSTYFICTKNNDVQVQVSVSKSKFSRLYNEKIWCVSHKWSVLVDILPVWPVRNQYDRYFTIILPVWYMTTVKREIIIKFYLRKWQYALAQEIPDFSLSKCYHQQQWPTPLVATSRAAARKCACRNTNCTIILEEVLTCPLGAHGRNPA